MHPNQEIETTGGIFVSGLRIRRHEQVLDFGAVWFAHPLAELAASREQMPEPEHQVGFVPRKKSRQP
jgi:hypothetical protein